MTSHILFVSVSHTGISVKLDPNPIWAVHEFTDVLCWYLSNTNIVKKLLLSKYCWSLACQEFALEAAMACSFSMFICDAIFQSSQDQGRKESYYCSLFAYVLEWQFLLWRTYISGYSTYLIGNSGNSLSYEQVHSSVSCSISLPRFLEVHFVHVYATVKTLMCYLWLEVNAVTELLPTRGERCTWENFWKVKNTLGTIYLWLVIVCSALVVSYIELGAYNHLQAWYRSL